VNPVLRRRVEQDLRKRYSPEQIANRPAIVKASPADQAALIAEEPSTFGVAPRVGRHGWVTVDLRRVRTDQVRELVEMAWQATAPKKEGRSPQRASEGCRRLSP